MLSLAICLSRALATKSTCRACMRCARDNLGPAMVKSRLFSFSPKASENLAEYLAVHLSATAPAATACLSSGATRLRINLAATASRAVSVPPQNEIFGILTYIGNATSPIRRFIDKIKRNRVNTRIPETRLIADVVTGQLDVREAVKGLPVEDVDGGEPVDAGDEDRRG